MCFANGFQDRRVDEGFPQESTWTHTPVFLLLSLVKRASCQGQMHLGTVHVTLNVNRESRSYKVYRSLHPYRVMSLQAILNQCYAKLLGVALTTLPQLFFVEATSQVKLSCQASVI